MSDIPTFSVPEPDDPWWHDKKALHRHRERLADKIEAERRSALPDTVRQIEDDMMRLFEERGFLCQPNTPNLRAQMKQLMEPEVERLNALPKEERIRIAVEWLSNQQYTGHEGVEDAFWVMPDLSDETGSMVPMASLSIKLAKPIERVEVEIKVVD